MPNLEAVSQTIEKMDARELRQAYRATFKIKALEPVRGLTPEMAALYHVRSKVMDWHSFDLPAPLPDVA
jgi:hypothetical protein